MPNVDFIQCYVRFETTFDTIPVPVALSRTKSWLVNFTGA